MGTNLFDVVVSELGLVEEKLRSGGDAMFAPLAEALFTLVDSGGKRVRPALVLLASRFGPGALLERTVSLAAAVETLHTATLVHDDLVDNAFLRRGHQTLNATWSRATTVLAGDYLFARAALFAAQTENTRVVTIFSQTLMTICEGELRQLFGAFDPEQDLASYYARIFAKTASLFAAATEAGAVLNGAPESHVAALREYGRSLGMSFQIEDDLLDFVGNEQELGKPVGSDLRQGIVTLPVYHFLQDNGRRAAWVRALGSQDGARDAAVEDLVQEIRQSPAIDACRAEARDFARRAQDALAPLPDLPEKRILLDLVDLLLDRRQ